MLTACVSGVRRAARLDELVGRVGHDDDLVSAAVAQRNRRAGRAGDALPGGQRPGVDTAPSSSELPVTWLVVER